MKPKIINIDDYLTVEKVIKREFSSDKFAFVVLDEDSGQVFSYIPHHLSDMESCYLIDCLADHRRINNEQ